MSPALRRHGWLIVLVVGLALFLLVERTMVATGNPNFVPSAILLGAAVVPVTFVSFVRGRRLDYVVGGGLLAAAALVGGVLATVVAGTLEFDVQQALGALPALGVAVIEEVSKLLVPAVLLLALHRRVSAADGLLLGVACGAGFAALETMGYAFTTLVGSRDGVVDALDVLVLRGVMSPAGHMAWTGITAAALFSLVHARRRGRAVLRVVLALVVAIALHTLWDGVGGLLVYLVLAVAGLGALTVIAHRIARERRRATSALDLPAPVPAAPQPWRTR